MSTNIIDIRSFLERVGNRPRDGRELLALIEGIETEWSKNARAVHRELIALLDQGLTTGDPFQDEVVHLVGLERNFSRLFEYNQEIMVSKGKEFLIVFQNIAGRSSVNNVFFGRLSGDRLRLFPEAKKHEFSARVPFERYVEGVSPRGTSDIRLEPMVLGECLLSCNIPDKFTGAYFLIAALLKDPKNPYFGFPYADVLLGEEIDEIAKTLPIIDQLRAVIK